MDTKEFQKYLPYKDNIYYEWFLVQYDQENDRKLTRKVVKTDELIWDEELQNIESYDEDHMKEHVVIRDQGKLHLGYILYKAKTQQECIGHHVFLQVLCMHLFHSPRECSYVMEHLHFNRCFWLLVKYTRSSRKEEELVYAVYHANDVILKMDSHLHTLMAFVQEDQATFKGTVVKISYDLNEIMYIMNKVVRTRLFRMFQEIVYTPALKFRQYNEKLALMNYRMQWESNILTRGIHLAEKRCTRLQYRIWYLRNALYRSFFYRQRFLVQ